MTTLSIPVSNEQLERLREVAAYRGVSLDKLFEDVVANVLAGHDAELRFRAAAAKGDAARGLAVLDELRARQAGKTG